MNHRLASPRERQHGRDRVRLQHRRCPACDYIYVQKGYYRFSPRFGWQLISEVPRGGQDFTFRLRCTTLADPHRRCCCEMTKEYSDLVGHHLLDCLLDAMDDPFMLLPCQ